MTTTIASGTVTHHPEFYFQNGTYVFQVENTLYKLNHDILVNESLVFANLFSFSVFAPESMEGKSDEEPIHVDPNLSVEVFDLFVELKFACAHPAANYSKQDLRRLLKFIDKYDCSAHILGFIISCIMEKSYHFHPSELIYFGATYKIQVLFEKGFSHLCEIPLTKIKRSHREQMGMDAYVAYVYVRAHLDEYIRTVAVQWPPVEHADSCQNHKGCAEDWAAVWWNGMGRLLLDPRNSLSFDDAVDCFKSLQFGQVSDDCKRYMFSKVMHINVPLAHSHRFITRIRDRLVQKLIPT
ncbi:hypothetical protein V8B97DRAFT_1983614 [Scleroderma yunnanense]